MSVSDKFLKKKLSVYISASIAGLVSSAYVGAQSEIEEVIVRSSFIDRTVDQIINPLHIVNGDD